MRGASVAVINAATDIDPLFLDQIALINEVAGEIVTRAGTLTAEALARAKRHGFFRPADWSAPRHLRGRCTRGALGIQPIRSTRWSIHVRARSRRPRRTCTLPTNLLPRFSRAKSQLCSS